MASTDDNIGLLTNAEDISQEGPTENFNLNSRPNLEEYSVGDGDAQVDKTAEMDQREEDNSESQRSNNSSMGDISNKKATVKIASDHEKCEPRMNGHVEAPEAEIDSNNYDTFGQVNYSFHSDSEEDFCVLRRARSDELLELKHHFQATECSEALNDYPSSVSEINAREYLALQTDYTNTFAAEQAATSPGRTSYSYNPYNPCSDSPGETSGESDQLSRRRRRRSSSGSHCEERIRSIEGEYSHRIGRLEERHFDLEDSLARLTSTLEPLFERATSEEFKPDDVADIYAACIDEDPDYPEDRAEEKAKIEELLLKTEQQKKRFAYMIGMELFLEFQEKMRNFVLELNGVLNCTEAAIRHARVVQEWGNSVQLMFEQMKDERMKLQEYIDERERSMIIWRNQFASELQQQGNILRDLVEDMKSYRDLYDVAEKYGGAVAPTVTRNQLAKSIVDLLLKQRVDGEKALILDLKKQSKISEMKLMAIHQQSFIQQIQEQNRELRAIIDALMGPEELNDSRQSRTLGSVSSPERGSLHLSGTPSSVSSSERSPYRSFCSPDRSSVLRSLERLLDRSRDPTVSKISDVLDCDRGETYPGISTDGDIATIQTYGIGPDIKRIDPGWKKIYDPLSLSYIRDQCRAVEETERRCNIQQQEEENKENVELDEGVPTFCDGVEALNIEPCLRKAAEKDTSLDESGGSEQGTEITMHIVKDREAGGDGSNREASDDIDIVKAANKVSPMSKHREPLLSYDSESKPTEPFVGNDDKDVDENDISIDECGLVDGIPVVEPPLIDIENTNNNDDLQ